MSLDLPPRRVRDHDVRDLIERIRAVRPGPVRLVGNPATVAAVRAPFPRANPLPEGTTLHADPRIPPHELYAVPDDEESEP